MNLLKYNMEPFCVMIGSRTDDGQSGKHTVWAEETVFSACVVTAQSYRNPQHNGQGIANMQDAAPAFTIFTSRAVVLPFHTVIKRMSDSMIFRITSDAALTKTPKGARLDLRMYAAEKWRLPYDQG